MWRSPAGSGRTAPPRAICRRPRCRATGKRPDSGAQVDWSGHTRDMPQPDLLRHYRLGVLEFWIGYLVASTIVALWFTPEQSDGLVVLIVFALALAATSMAAIVVIERRRPWPFGPHLESYRFPSRWNLVISFVVIVLSRFVIAWFDPYGMRATLIALFGLLVLSWTLSVLWRPLRSRVYPYLDRPSAGDTVATR